MDPESKKLLNDTFLLAQENNRMLHDIRRSMFWSRIMSAIYWILIIGSAIGAFYFVQPYVDQIIKTYGSIGNALKNFQN